MTEQAKPNPKQDPKAAASAAQSAKRKQAMTAADCKRFGLDPAVYGHRRSKQA